MRTVALVFLCLGACGGGDDGGDNGGGGATITLGGAESGTVPAQAVASKVDGEAFYTVGVAGTAPRAQFTSASASFRLAGTPAAGTYTVAAFQVGVLEATTSGGKSFTAYSTPVIGTIGALTLTSVDVQGTQLGTTLYTVHGTLATSTLKDSQGGADLTMSASF